jgi:hypothetical protein
MAVISSGQITLTDLNDTRQLILYLNGNYKTQIYNANASASADSSYNPNFASSNLVITPELYIAGGDGSNLLPSSDVQSIKWYEGTQTTTPLAENSTGGTTPAGYTYTIPTGAVATVAKPLTIKSNLKSANTQIYTCEVVYRDPKTNFNVTAKAQFEILKVTNGQKGDAGVNAITVVMTNENATVATNSSGGSGVYTGTATQIHVYEGSTALQYDGTGTSNGTFKVTQGTATGITAGTLTDGGSYANIGVASNITADTATVPYTITGKRQDGTTFTAEKTLSITRVKAGVDGTTPTSYWLITDVGAINKDVNGTYTPNKVVATGMKQTGTGAPGSYSTWYRFSESTDGSTFSTKQTSTGNTTTATYSFSAANLKAIKVEMFVAGGTSTKLDEVIIPIVADGATGIDAYYLNVWAPDGDTIRNGSGNIGLQADLYKGAGLATGSITYQWYIQDPSSTAAGANGGDADGGDGWRKLDTTTNYGVTGYTTKNITVPPGAIAGVEGFKCVAKQSGNNYSGVIIVRDFQDPIAVNILGTNVFKNGVGSVTLTVQLLQAGEEVATTGYTFEWALYSSAGSLIKTYSETGPTITVAATDVSGTANLVVDVLKA